MRWTYNIDDVQVYPLNPRENSIKDSLTDDVLYAYRKAFSGSIKLKDADYDYLKTLEENGKHEKHTLNIFDNSVLHHSCEFTIYNCKFDDYKRTCEIEVSDRDSYTEIQEKEEILVDVIVGDKVKVSAEVYSQFIFGLYIVFVTPHDFLRQKVISSKFYKRWYHPGGETYENMYLCVTVTEQITVGKDENFPVRDVTPTTGFVARLEEFVEGNPWTLIVTLDDHLIYERVPENFTLTELAGHYAWPCGTYWDLYDDQVENGTFEHYTFSKPPFPVTDENPDLDDYPEEMYDFYVKKSAYSGRANVVYTRNYAAYLLRDVVNKVLSVAVPSFAGTFKSSLFFNDLPESGKTLPSGYPVRSNSLALITLSDFKRPNATQKATKAEITLRQVIEYFCKKFKARWFIDSDGDFRIEHLIYTDPTLNLDISSDPLLTRDYFYSSNDKPNSETLSESIAYSEDFDQITTLYGTVPALKGEKENTKSTPLSDFYTDIDGMNNNIQNLPEDGFVLVDYSNDAVVKATGFKTGKTGLQNVNLSNSNVLNDYHRYKAYQQTYQIAGREVDAISLKWMKKQEQNFTSVPDKTKLLTTRIGSGKILSLDYKLTEEVTFKAEVIYE